MTHHERMTDRADSQIMSGWNISTALTAFHEECARLSSSMMNGRSQIRGLDGAEDADLELLSLEVHIYYR